MSILSLTVVALSLLSAASACSVVPGGCTAAKCAALSKKQVQNGAGMGFWMGIWNKNVPKSLNAQKGGPWINYEIFQEIGYLLALGKSTSLSACCSECAATAGCVTYQFFVKASVSSGRTAVKGFVPGTQCYLLKGGSVKIDNPKYGTPFSGTHSQQVPAYKKFDASYVGGVCNPAPDVVDDPHFTGALGTRFDFNGDLDKSFCLTADKQLQVNILLRGYNDARTENEKALRSWIKEVGLIWTGADGTAHKVHMVARNGKTQERANGFMAQLTVDGVEVPVPSAEGESVQMDGGFSLSFVNVEKLGPYEVEYFTIKIAGLAEIDVRMRVAHAALQSENDAEAHFNLAFVKLETTPSVHGVLGQTYRNSEEQAKKALRYSELSALLHGPIVADGESGKGFLEGEVKDYETSDVLSADCRFSNLAMI